MSRRFAPRPAALGDEMDERIREEEVYGAVDIDWHEEDDRVRRDLVVHRDLKPANANTTTSTDRRRG